MWSDMQQGHRTLAGDADFVTSLRFRPTDIEPDDVARLVANRVTLLVINRALLRRGPAALSADVQRAIVRHAMKAIVGVGDALLFARGLYDGSYLVKRDRMRALGAAAPARLLARALRRGHRLPPRAARCAHAPRRARSVERGTGAPGVRGTPLPRGRAPRAPGPRVERPPARACATRSAASESGARRAPRATSPRVASPSPRSCRSSRTARGRRWPAALLSSPPDAASLDLAYLRAWARRGDPAFAAVARKLGLDLTPPAPRPVGALLSEVSA